MVSNKSTFANIIGSLVVAMVLVLFLPTGVNAQYVNGTIDAGTTITVRTNETIDARDDDGRVFSGVVEGDVKNRNGTVAIPRGSDVEMVVRQTSDDQVALDLETITVNGRRYSVDTDENLVETERKEGVGINKRTGKYVGGGAVIGAIIGAIAGGGKGAAIGAGVGAAGGAGAQILTRGRSVNVPSESLVTFRLQRPLRTGVNDETRGRYKPGYSIDDSNGTAAYRAGFSAGRSDAARDLPRDYRTTSWTSSSDRRDYEAGYDRGYENASAGTRPYNDRYDYEGVGRIQIGNNKDISWEAPSIARVYVQMDNEPEKLFAEGQSGVQAAPWIESGHVYNFVIRDLRGNEIARDRLDLRSRGRYRSR
jgi:hypothetical protein